MAKPEWGQKRSCLSCGDRFYDLRRSPTVCPKCGAVFDPEQMTKTRRTKASAAKVPVKAPAKPPPEQEKAEALIDGEAVVAVDDEAVDAVDDDDDQVLEDASELGEDEDDIAEVPVARKEEEA